MRTETNRELIELINLTKEIRNHIYYDLSYYTNESEFLGFPPGKIGIHEVIYEQSANLINPQMWLSFKVWETAGPPPGHDFSILLNHLPSHIPVEGVIHGNPVKTQHPARHFPIEFSLEQYTNRKSIYETGHAWLWRIHCRSRLYEPGTRVKFTGLFECEAVVEYAGITDSVPHFICAVDGEIHNLKQGPWQLFVEEIPHPVYVKGNAK